MTPPLTYAFSGAWCVRSANRQAGGQEGGGADRRGVFLACKAPVLFGVCDLVVPLRAPLVGVAQQPVVIILLAWRELRAVWALTPPSCGRKILRFSTWCCCARYASGFWFGKMRFSLVVPCSKTLLGASVSEGISLIVGVCGKCTLVNNFGAMCAVRILPVSFHHEGGRRGRNSSRRLPQEFLPHGSRRTHHMYACIYHTYGDTGAGSSFSLLTTKPIQWSMRRSLRRRKSVRPGPRPCRCHAVCSCNALLSSCSSYRTKKNGGVPAAGGVSV